MHNSGFCCSGHLFLCMQYVNKVYWITFLFEVIKVFPEFTFEILKEKKKAKFVCK